MSERLPSLRTAIELRSAENASPRFRSVTEAITASTGVLATLIKVGERVRKHDFAVPTQSEGTSSS